MAKKLLSFLGTNKYIECNYYFGDKKIKNVHYVQEAIAKLFCNEWGKEDSIIVFVTDEAYEKNWVTGTNYENKTIDGLKKVLHAFAQENNVTVRHVKIPGGQNEKEIWSIFDAVVNSVNQDDEIMIDVTHAFRAIPMLAVVMINYLKMVKNVSFIGLYYGAVESLGRISDVASKDIQERNAPIIDLSSFVYLFEFTNLLNNFMVYGDAKGLSAVAVDAVRPILKETQGSDQDSIKIKRIAERLQKMTENFAYCRGKDIIDFDYSVLYNDIMSIKDSFTNGVLTLKPFQPLFSNIMSKLEPFKDYDSNKNINKGIAAAEWCLNHNLIQQCITILQESIITYVLIKQKMDYLNINNRELVSKAFYALNPRCSVSGTQIKDNNEIIEKLKHDNFVQNIKVDYDRLSQIRNDINHANFRNDNISPRSIKGTIENIITKVKENMI